MSNNKIHKIKTPNGIGILDNIHVSELGFVMVRVYFPEDKNWITWNINKLENILENTELSLYLQK